MKFLLTANGMKEVSDPSFFEIAHEKFQDFSELIVGKEMEVIVRPFLSFIEDCFVNLGHWFIANLPDIMGYSTILCGICVILCSFSKNTTIVKPLGIWGIANIIAICILGGV